jgi:orotidine-5'-phosphate decarboxylase
VEKAARMTVELGVSMFTLHASGGSKMMKAAAAAVAASQGAHPVLILGVTVLTSLGQGDLAEVGIHAPVSEQVLRLAGLARDCGLGGLVASPQEVAAIRDRVGSGIKIVTPGIRPSGADLNDQSRIATPAAAIRDGADYLVVGRPITAHADPAGSAERIAEEIAGTT